MSKQIRKGGKVSTRATFPMSEMLSGNSVLNLTTVKNEITAREMRNAAAIRRVHHN